MIRFKQLIRIAALSALGIGGAMGDGPMVPPGAPPVPPAELSGFSDFSDIQNREAAEFLYGNHLISALRDGDAFRFGPAEPVDAEALLQSVRGRLPGFQADFSGLSRDEAVGRCYTEMQKQGLTLLEENLEADRYTVPEGAWLAARPGKQVTLTVDGVETRIEPGRTYSGKVCLTVTQCRKIVHMFDVYPGRTALCVENGINRAASATKAILSGSFSDASAENLVINSQNDYFNPILIGGGSYMLKNPQLILNGHGGDDFAGYGAGIMVTGDANVVIDGGSIDTVGSIRTAVWLGGHSKALIKNLTIRGKDGPTTDFPVSVMNTVPWPLGLTGNLRATNLLEWAEGTYLNCDVSCENWGVMSTDGTWRGSKLTCINTTATITGQSGYGAYCDMGVEDCFYGSTLTVPDYGVVIGGGFCGSTFGPASRENIGALYDELPPERRDAPTVVRSRKNAVMIHSNQGGHCTLQPGTRFYADRAVILVKGMLGKEVTTRIEARGAQLSSSAGILLHLMESDDAGSPGAAGFQIQPAVPVKTDLDTGDAENPTTLHADFSDMELTGDIYNTRWTGGQNLCVRLAASTLRGCVSAGVQRHKNVPPGGYITKETFYEIGNVAVTPAPAVSNGMILLLEEGSTWVPTAESFLSRLDIGPGCKVCGTVCVDGTPVDASREGSYTGQIVVTP